MEHLNPSSSRIPPDRTSEDQHPPSLSHSPTTEHDSYSHQPPNSIDDQSPPEQSPATSPQSEAAPETTLWENFMATLRNVIHRSPFDPAHAAQQPVVASDAESASLSGPHRSSPSANPSDVHAGEQTRMHTAPSSSAPAAPTEPTRTSTHSSGARSADEEASRLLNPPVFFRMPFNRPDGNPELLAFHPQPLPRQESGSPSDQRPTTQNRSASQPSSNTSPTPPSRQATTPQHGAHTAGQSDASTGTLPTAPHAFPHPEGHVPISPLFVPFGASPLPFSFIYDPNTQMAWPIAHVVPGSPPGGPSPDAPESQQPRLVAGPPFHLILGIHFTAPPAPEQPDSEKAATYVKQLERADAELRARMARLGMGSIGGFADASPADDQHALLGCGVCLENYDAEDRPEWIDGPKSQDDAVVAVPCPGHHTLHAGCLRDWLAKLPPSQWTCPFCRASLNPDTKHDSKQESSRASPKPASSGTAPKTTTLREQVHARERARGWRCDYAACLPRYPISSCTDHGHLDLLETSIGMTTDLVKLVPCRHEIHLDCLCTSMRVENGPRGTDDLVPVVDNEENDSSDSPGQSTNGAVQSAEADTEKDERNTVGKWVTCPTCRKECWAELPLRRRPQRSVPEDPTQHATSPTSSETPATSASSDETASASLLHQTGSDNKGLHVQETVGQDQSSGGQANDRADSPVDPDEEATVDALLLSI